MSSSWSGRQRKAVTLSQVSGELRAGLRPILGVLASVPRRGVIDPANVALQVRIDALATLGYLHVLVDAGFGVFVVRVVDEGGREIARFPTVSDVPVEIETEYGQTVGVLPEHIDIAFEPARIDEALEALGKN